MCLFRANMRATNTRKNWSNIGIPCDSDVVEAEIASATATDTEAVVVVVCCSALIADAVRSKTNN